MEQEKLRAHMTEAAALNAGALSQIMHAQMTFAALIVQRVLYTVDQSIAKMPQPYGVKMDLDAPQKCCRYDLLSHDQY